MTAHKHSFSWDDDEARYCCRCGAQEATCVADGKRLGTVRVPVGPLTFCDDRCRARHTRLTAGAPLGLVKLFRMGRQ